MLEAVIFDFDGIIADTERLHYLAFERILAPQGRGITWEQYVDTCIGFDDRDVFRHRLGGVHGALADHELPALLERKAKAFIDLVHEQGAPVYPGVESLVARLESDSIPIALCSGAVRSDIEAVLQATSFAEAFPVIVTAEDVARSKPDPESYTKTMERAAQHYAGRDIRPGTAVAIEDTPTGIESAKSAGLAVVAVTNTHPEEALGAADAVVASLLEVTEELLAEALPPSSGGQG